MHDILEVLDMKVAGELTSMKAVQQLTMCTSMCGELLDESHFTHGIKEKHPKHQTQLDNAGFIRHKKVRLMDGHCSSSAILAPPLLMTQHNVISKRVSCFQCGKWFGTTQGLGSHMRKKHGDDPNSLCGSLTRFLTAPKGAGDSPEESQLPAASRSASGICAAAITPPPNNNNYT